MVDLFTVSCRKLKLKQMKELAIAVEDEQLREYKREVGCSLRICVLCLLIFIVCV